MTTLMCGSNVYNDVTNENIIKETILYIKQSGRFKKLEISPKVYFSPSHAYPLFSPHTDRLNVSSESQVT